MSNYHIKHLEEYFQVYRKSVRYPEKFWEEIAEEHFLWRKRWDKVLEWDFSKPEVKWFEGAKLNITENCIDKHLFSHGDDTAIIFEPNNPDEEAQHISYNELHRRVCKFANVLKSKGIKKGDLNLDKFSIRKDLQDLINAGLSLSAASKYLAKKNGLKKSEVYNLI